MTTMTAENFTTQKLMMTRTAEDTMTANTARQNPETLTAAHADRRGSVVRFLKMLGQAPACY